MQIDKTPQLAYWHLWTDPNGVSWQTRCGAGLGIDLGCWARKLPISASLTPQKISQHDSFIVLFIARSKNEGNWAMPGQRS